MHDLHKFTFSDIFLSYEYSFTFKVIISIQHRCYILYASLFTHQDTSILNNVFLVSMDVTSLYTPGGYSKRFFPGRLRPEVQPLTLIYHFGQKRYAFPIPSIEE